MARKEKTLSNIEMMELQQQALEKAKRVERIKKEAKPSLLTRYFTAFIDFVITIIGVLILMTFLSSPYLQVTNYSKYVDESKQVLIATNLYDVNSNNSLVKKEYSETVYEQVITDYYSTDAYAISKNMLQDYKNSKIESELYELVSDNVVKKAEVTDDQIKEFLENEYKYALDFAESNPDFIIPNNKTFLIFAIGVGIALLISSSIFYLLIPLCRKEGETLAQMMFKICIIDTERFDTVKRSQIVLRYFFAVFFNYYVSGLLYILIGPYFMFLPILISTFVMGFTKGNRCIHELLTNTMVICKHRTNAQMILNSIRQSDEIDKMSRY